MIGSPGRPTSPGERQANAVGFEHHRRRTQHVPGVESLVAEAVRHLPLLPQRDRPEKRIGPLGVLDGVQRRALTVVPADLAAMFAAAIAELGVLLLNKLESASVARHKSDGRRVV